MFSPNQDQSTVLQAKITDLEQQLHQCQMELQQAQGNQCATEPMLHEILEQVPSAIARVRIFHDYRIEYMYCSRGHETVFGYPPEEFITDSTLWLSRVIPEDRETIIFQAGFESTFTEQSFTVEYRFCCKDGSLRWISSTFRSQRDAAANCWIATGVSTDITHRKQAEAALHQSEEKFRQVAENSNEVFFVESADSDQVLYASPAFEKIWQVPCEILYRQPQAWFEAIHPDDREQVVSDLDQKSQGKSVAREFRIIRPNGEIRWVFSRSSPVYDEAGQLIRHVGIIEDITERKQAEQKIQFQASLLDQVHNAVICTDLEGNITYWNRFAETLYQWKAAEVIGQSLLDIIVPPGQESVVAAEFEQLQQTQYFEGERLLKRKDGTLLTILFATTALRDESGKATGFVGVSIDISDRKQAEAALQQLNQELELRVQARTQELEQSQARLWERKQSLKTLLENTPDIVARFDRDLRHLYINPVIEQITGIATDQFIGRTNQDLGMPEDLTAAWSKHLQSVFDSGLPGEYEFAFPAISGVRQYQSKLVPEFAPDGVITSVLAISRDITNFKQAQDALYQSEQKYATLAETVPVGIFYADVQANGLYHNSRWYEITGLTEIESQGLGWLQAIHPDDRDRLMASWHNAVQSDSSYQAEHRLLHRDGSVIWVVAQATPERDDFGQIIGYLGTVTDISDRKQIEEALRQSEELFRKLFEEAPIGIALSRVSDYRLYKANQMFCQTFGYSAEELAELAYTDLTYPDDLAAELPLAEQMLTGLIPNYQIEKRYIRRSGEVFWGHLTTTIFRDSANQPIIAFGMVQDITDRKRTEKQLQHSEALLREAQQIAQLGRWEFDVTTQKITWSEEKFRIFGLAPTQLAPTYEQLLQHHIHPDDRGRLSLAVTRAIEQAEPYTLDLRIIESDRTVGYVLVKGQPIFNEQGQVVKLFGIVMDISDRKQAETALQQQAQREQLLRLITQRVRQSLDLDEILSTAVTEVRQTFQADRALIFRLLPEGRGQVIKEAVLPEYPALGEGLWTDACLYPDSIKYYYVGQPRIVSDVALDEWGECLGQFLRQIGVRSKISAPIIQSLDGSTQVWGLLIVHACAHHRQWLPEEAVFLQQISNQLAIAIQQSNLYQRVQTELVERQQAEEQLLASLQEKEVLLKEVHHRVKNNMQMISSLLNLQADSIQAPEVLQIFIESQRRVKTMALIHEKLYQSHNLAQISFADYVQQLADDLLQSFKAPRSHIHMVVEVTNVNLTVDTAIPCGLIINELVTNALKYAFPQGRTGEIHIRFIPDPANSSPDNHRYVLSVKDNGVGIPEHIQCFETESLGLQIVWILTEKLKGTINLDRTNGTEFNIVVPLFDKIHKT